MTLTTTRSPASASRSSSGGLGRVLHEHVGRRRNAEGLEQLEPLGLEQHGGAAGPRAGETPWMRATSIVIGRPRDRRGTPSGSSRTTDAPLAAKSDLDEVLHRLDLQREPWEAAPTMTMLVARADPAWRASRSASISTAPGSARICRWMLVERAGSR